MLDSKGLTLIEVLAAVSILGLLALGFIAIPDKTLFSLRENDRKSEAIEIAENIANDLRDDGALSPELEIPDYFGYEVQESPLNNPTYITASFAGKEHVSAQAIVLSGGEPKLLTVTVYWEAVTPSEER